MPQTILPHACIRHCLTEEISVHRQAQQQTEDEAQKSVLKRRTVVNISAVAATGADAALRAPQTLPSVVRELRQPPVPGPVPGNLLQKNAT